MNNITTNNSQKKFYNITLQKDSIGIKLIYPGSFKLKLFAKSVMRSITSNWLLLLNRDYVLKVK